MALTDQQKASINSQLVGARERRNAIAFGDLLSPLASQAAHVANPTAVAAPATYTQTAGAGYVQATYQTTIDQLDAMTDKIIELQPIIAKVTALIAALETAGLMASS